MGLDMYLRGKRYLSSHKNEDKQIIDVIVAEQIPGMGSMMPTYIVTEAMYWRKANHIHQWFVDNVQGGEDECRPHYVSGEQLKELANLCREVLTNRDKAAELMPTSDGFFFGGTDYDDYYFEECQRTADQIDALLATPHIDSWYFEYQSSW